MTNRLSIPALSSSQTARYSFLDLYRGLFVVLMLEGHVVRALLSPEWKSTSLFTLHELLHGITAPGFFFGAGFAFAISSLRRWDIITSISWGWARRAGRGLMLIALGYVLHVPFLSIQKVIAQATTQQWNDFLAFGVLQCVGVTLFFLYLLLAVLRNDRLFSRLVALLVPVVVFFSPSVAAWSDNPMIPLWIRSALNSFTGSPYPIFPFAGFILAGVVAAWLFLHAEGRKNGDRFIVLLLVSGVFLVLFALLSERFLWSSVNEATYWATSPNFFWIRLGILFIVLSALWFFEELLAHETFPRWLTVLGVESFFVYLLHLLFLYGWVTNPRFHVVALFGESLGFAGAIVIFIFFVPAMYYAASYWRILKKDHALLVRGVLFWLSFSIAFSFFFHPY